MRVLIVALLAAISYAQTAPRRLLARGGDCQDVWAKKDCNVIEKKGDCFAYYEYCQRSCRCDFDLAAAREAAGVDDDTVSTMSSSNTCVNGDDFVDSRGFNCEVYEGAGWCVRSDEDEVVFGEGWCKRWPRDSFNDSPCDVMPGRKRMYTFEHYANDAGIDARVCCCNQLAEDDYPYNRGWDNYDASQPEGTYCNDKQFENGHDWHDKRGWTCKAYHYGDLCDADGTRGGGWNNAEWGTLQEWGREEENAKHMCCACGGGHTTPNYDDIPGVELRRLDKFVPKGMSVQAWNKVRKHTRQILARDLNLAPEIGTIIVQMNQLAQDRLTDEAWAQFMDLWNELRDLHPDYQWIDAIEG